VHSRHNGYVQSNQPLDGLDERAGVQLHLAKFVDDRNPACPDRLLKRRQGNALEGWDVHPVAADPRTLGESYLRHNRRAAADRLDPETCALILVTNLTRGESCYHDAAGPQLSDDPRH
jgi:hypothetical protein